jgi:hypothetical protein
MLVLLPAAVAFLGLNVWVLVTSLRTCVVLVVAYVVYVAAGLTYQALLAGQWD